MSEYLQENSERNYNIEIINTTLSIEPGEHKRITSEIEKIKKIFELETAIVEAAKAADEIDHQQRAKDASERLSTLPVYDGLIFSPMLDYFPKFKGHFSDIYPEPNSAPAEFEVGPIAVNSSLVVLSGLGGEINREGMSKNSYALVFDYSKPVQEVEVRYLTTKGDECALDYDEQLVQPLVDQLQVPASMTE